VNADSYEFDVFLDPRAHGIGIVKDTLLVSFLAQGSRLEEKAFEIPVRAKITGSIKASPPTLFLGILQKGDSKEGGLTIESTNGQAVELVSFESVGIEGMETKLLASEGQKIRLFYKAHVLQEGNLQGELRVKTRLLEEKREEDIAIPIVGMVKNKV
jgi:hypothetical protein